MTLSTTVRQFIKFVLGVKLLARSLIEASNSFANFRKNILFPEPKVSNATVQRFEDVAWLNYLY